MQGRHSAHEAAVFELFIAIGLILLNGAFALSELAIVSSRKPRLRALADEGKPGAAQSLALAENPGRFLSTVQIGITLVGILAGVFSGAALSEGVEEHVVDGVTVHVTSVAKTVADCFKHRNKIGLDVALEAEDEFGAAAADIKEEDSRIQVETQAREPAFSQYRENLRWRSGPALFVTLNVPGSNNAIGRGPAAEREQAGRLAGIIRASR